MKKILSTILFFFLLTASGHAQSVKTLVLNATTPSTFGIYDQLRLVPRGDLTNCSVGSFYVPISSNRIMYCTAPNTWAILSAFQQIGDDIIPADTNNPELKRLSIGTSTPEFMLTLDQDGGIMAKGTTLLSGRSLSTAGAGIRMFWYPQKAAFRAGEITAAFPDRWDDPQIGLHSVAFGKDSQASGQFSVVSGGERQRALTDYSTIGGGFDNWISDASGTIGGGTVNRVHADTGTISGGSQNTIHGGSNAAVISGGLTNRIFADALEATISGGELNEVGADAHYAVVSGGKNNEANAPYATVTGGFKNIVNGGFGTASGNVNRVDGVGSWVGGQNIWIRDLGTPSNEGRFVFAYGIAGNPGASPPDPQLEISQNNSAVFWGVNVGIGTVTPTHPLHVNALLKLEPQASPPGGATSCDEASETGVMYVDNNPTPPTLCLCDGGSSNWIAVGGGGDCT